MARVTSSDLRSAIDSVLQTLHGISDLYPNQYSLLVKLLDSNNIFFTDSTNSGKTLPAIIFPDIVKELSKAGYVYPANPKLLFVTALNSLQLSLVNNTRALGLKCEAVTTENIDRVMKSDTALLFISPEVLKQPTVTQILLHYRSSFVLKVVDECHLGNHLDFYLSKSDLNIMACLTL